MEGISFWKAILITLGILTVALGFIYVASLLGLNDPWIPFLALTVWGALGMKMEEAPGVFLGGAVGLLISLSLELLPDLYGDAAAIIPVVAIILAISCKIKGWLPLFCNFGMFTFLTVGTADVLLDQRLQLPYLQNLAFGALCFWIVPWLILRLWSRGKQDTDKASPSARGRYVAE